MKELSIEEKAKRYDEIIERAKEKYAMFEGMQPGDVLEDVFPEIKESEDERIKEWLINLVKGHIEWLEDRIREQLSNGQVYGGELVKAKNSLAWLEKQGEQKPYGQRQECVDCQFNYDGECKGSCAMKRGEQKPADKVEPKFKAGDWVVYQNATFQVRSFSNGALVLQGEKYQTYFIEELCRQWTIQDAKDGDVLLFEGNYNSIVLFHGIGINGKGRINYHCKCDLGNHSFGVQGNTAYLGTIEENAEHYHPATKEQRDLLFQKMKEAGYEWDAEKKELKKIEQKPTDEDIKEALRTEYEKGRADAIAEMQQLDALHDAAVYVDKSMFPYPKGTLKLREG